MSVPSTSSTLLCAISGQPLQGEDAVVTPSGRICSRALILSKMADNGGTDPFTNQPLDEMQLINLVPQSESIIPPRPSATSMPELLKLLNTEYSALVLELFDARQLLEETRKELSQSLYQNDAAVRVIARISMERDAARQELIAYQERLAVTSTTPRTATPTATATPVADHDDDHDDDVHDKNNGVHDTSEPMKKKQRSDNNNNNHHSTIPTAIPQEHVDIMTKTWQDLSQARKAEKKQMAANAPSLEALATYQEIDKKAYHKTKGKQGIVAVATSVTGAIVTAGKDKQVCVFDGEQISHTYSVGDCTLVDALQDLVVVVAASDNTVTLFQGEEERLKVTVDETIVGVHLHPSQQHFVLTTTCSVVIYSIMGAKVLASFASADGENNTCAALHPDGLLHAVGTSTGKMCLWDFKSQKLASTLSSGNASMGGIVFSNSGYHVATISDKLTIWDLKRQSILKELENSVTAAAFDPSGKYVAFADSTSLAIALVKELTPICKIQVESISSLHWTTKQLISASSNERSVRFFGISKVD